MSGYLIWIILAVATGIICYFIAKKKNKDALTWFMIGLILNIFAVVIIILIKTKQQKI